MGVVKEVITGSTNWTVCSPNDQEWHCGHCYCCVEQTKTKAYCKGSEISDVPQDLPRNITNL